ncbi:hypothetical protein BSAF29S_04951 [Bacillus safensis subsp. safensis]
METEQRGFWGIKRGSKMNSLLIINFIAFAAVTAYAVYLFVYLIRTRAAYIRLGKKEEFQQDMKKRLERVWVNVFGQKEAVKGQEERHHSCAVFLRIYPRTVRSP